MKKGFLYILLSVRLCAFGQDHNLDYYLGRARDNSPLLKDYQNQLLSNGVDSQLIRASYLPQVNGVSNNSYAPLIGGYGYDNAVTNGGQLSAQVLATKTFVGRNYLSAQYQTLSLNQKTIGNATAIARRDLKKTVTAQYITAYGDMVIMNFNRETLALLQKEEGILKGLTQANIYKQTDYLTFYVTMQQQQLIFRQSEIQFRNDFALLNYLCGVVDTAVTDLPDPGLKMSVLPDAYSSEFYRQYTIDSLKNINQHALVNYSYKPKLSVFADAGYLSSYPFQLGRNFGTSFGLSLNVPIYDGKQRQMKFKKIDIAERTRTGYRDFFLRQYDQQIAQLTQQLRATESLIEDIRGQIKYSSALIEVNAKLLETGNVRITELVLAINTWLNARNLLNQNYTSRLQIINQINYWEAL
ncbi:TolC family protein [Flavitalea sp. BT771]|uniref:TolC family protein n=1 Tax=Flavitalea sp. BT771 TaxID=3063329 RepID=UPI0026E258B0|nr:TolC family protein [Flavitalea sp. BT771]MDO6432521.1 TolC family protein [Flavitalea sp. BT771]MDV6221430.1 TolC family protein [Flavitalea sp. BT771]